MHIHTTKISEMSRLPPQVADHQIQMPRYNGLDKCEWQAGKKQVCPHQTFPVPKRPTGPAKSVLEFIGDTPLVKLERLMKLYDLPCDLYAKCEFFNAGGSVKDRIGLRMIEEAERSGRLKVGDTIIEPTSGNTGVGLCIAAAIKGYKMIITMPEKMSAEKVNMMKCLGAEIIRSPDEAAWDSPESHIGIAVKLNQSIPNSHILDQYKNPANPLAHYEGTGAEILSQLKNEVLAVVVAAGTGGTLTGIARRVKDQVPSCKVIAVDPVGSILAQPDSLNDFKRLQGYQVEGIGYDFIPTVLDRTVVDEWIKIDDPEALKCARDLIHYEALLCGGSSGTNLAGTIKWICSQPRESLVGKKVVTILPDSSRNYMSKFLDDNWMLDKGFMSYDKAPQSQQSWSSQKLSAVNLVKPAVTVPSGTLLAQLADHFTKTSEVLVVGENGAILGSVNQVSFLTALSTGKAQPSASVNTFMNRKPKLIPSDTPIGHVAKMMEMHASVFVLPAGVVSRVDVLKFVVENADSKENKHSTQAK